MIFQVESIETTSVSRIFRCCSQFQSIKEEPFFQLVEHQRLTEDSTNDRIKKLCPIFDEGVWKILVLTEENKLFRFFIESGSEKVRFDVGNFEEFSGSTIRSFGACRNKSWLICLFENGRVELFDFELRTTSIFRKQFSENFIFVSRRFKI